MTDQNNQCTLCERRSIPNIVAITWCSICEEALCKSCNSVHSLLKATCNHQTSNFDEYKKLPPFLLSLKLTCDDHNNPFTLYCPAHKEPCCCHCTTSKHKTCHGFETLESLIKESSSSSTILDLECAVDELNINVEKVLSNRKDALKTLDDQILDLASSIKLTRQQVNEKLDKNEKEILHQLSTLHISYKSEIENIIESLKTTKATIVSVQKSIEDMKNFASDSHSFFGSRRLFSTLNDEAQSFRKLFNCESTLKQKTVELKFLPGSLLQSDNIFGKLDVKEADNEILFTKNASLEAELSVDILTDIDAIQLRTNVQFQMENSAFTRRLAGCTFLGKDRLLFADWSENNELLFFDERGKSIKNFPLDKKAFDVCYIGDNSVAVTYPDAKQLSIMDLKLRKEKVVVSFENRCWGVTFSEGKLFVREYSVGIHCLDMNGKVLKTVQVDGYITHITSFSGKLYFTEHSPDAVHCCDEDGTEKVQSIVIVFVCLFSCYNAQWSVGGKLSHGSSGPQLKLDLSHSSKRFDFTAGGYYGSGGDWGASAGFRWRFKRSTQKPLYHIRIQASPCNFEFYDGNRDGIITKQEMQDLFHTNISLGKRLYRALKTSRGYYGITENDFNKNSRIFIAECKEYTY